MGCFISAPALSLLCNDPLGCYWLHSAGFGAVRAPALGVVTVPRIATPPPVSRSLPRPVSEHLRRLLARAILPTRLPRGAPCSPLAFVAGCWTYVCSG